jgi:hypothetical protein
MRDDYAKKLKEWERRAERAYPPVVRTLQFQTREQETAYYGFEWPERWSVCRGMASRNELSDLF